MEPYCRAIDSEDLVPGARFCIECFRYKTKDHECRDFKFGGATLVEQKQTAKGRKYWEVRKGNK